AVEVPVRLRPADRAAGATGLPAAAGGGPLARRRAVTAGAACAAAAVRHIYKAPAGRSGNICKAAAAAAHIRHAAFAPESFRAQNLTEAGRGPRAGLARALPRWLAAPASVASERWVGHEPTRNQSVVAQGHAGPVDGLPAAAAVGRGSRDRGSVDRSDAPRPGLLPPAV